MSSVRLRFLCPYERKQSLHSLRIRTNVRIWRYSVCFDYVGYRLHSRKHSYWPCTDLLAMPPWHLLFRRRLLLHALPRRHLWQLRGLDLIRLHRPVRLHGGLSPWYGLPAAHHRPLVRLLGRACSPLLARRAPVAGREPVQPAARRPCHCTARRVPAARRDLQHPGLEHGRGRGRRHPLHCRHGRRAEH